MVLKILLDRWLNSTRVGYIRSHSTMITMCLSSIITVIIINSFREFYQSASVILTKIENPRTQCDFDNSVLYKRYLLGFMNNYVPTFYEAFFKGSFARLPHQMTFLRKDLCQPSSCTVALCIQLGFLLTIRTFMGNICTAIYPPLKNILRSLKEQCCRKVCQKNPAIKQTLPQWEEEYYLEPLDTYSVTEEFSEMVIRFGYITFFSKAFPLAALCALLNNLIELRSDAYKFVKSHRRVVPVEKSGIGAWNGILRSLSYISTAINAFVIAFTSDWVETEVYRQTRGNGSLKGFVNSTLSKYATSDNRAYHSVNNREEFCYFRGNYYPPENPTKYGITQLYWMNLMFKFVAVFLFEHVMLLCNTLFTYCLSYKPESVQLQLDLIRHKEKEMRLTECERKLEERVKSDTKLSKNLRGLK
ncbi:anoctamin-4-like isoform X2 [Dendroctonus ponderosae]|uniref:anoctamin-4-like isoform X2 n=1 Tax=Dendroctonus ponderosae TaxID=77166 RepID=UPI00203531C2|nr:anoctamin-4-like isoform X2 [Dendroctonus ponderosae]